MYKNVSEPPRIIVMERVASVINELRPKTRNYKIQRTMVCGIKLKLNQTVTAIMVGVAATS